MTNRNRIELVTLAIAVFLLTNCFRKDFSCRENYIGTFIFDDSIQIYEPYKKLIKSRGWDTILLISDSTGKYYFDTGDPILKKSEGTWYLKSGDIESTCMGYIKQNNHSKDISFIPFQVTIFANDSMRFTMPFKKISDQTR